MPVDPWKRGDRFSAAHMNQGFDVARKWASVSGVGLTIEQTPTGTVLKVNGGPDGLNIRVGVIVNHGPSAAPDYTDGRYYVVPIFLGHANPTDIADPHQASVVTDENGDPVEQFPVTATYLQEVTGGHTLPTNGTQYVLLIQMATAATTDGATAGLPQYIIVPLGAGSSEPPGLKYQVKMKLDDNNTVGYDDLRFM